MDPWAEKYANWSTYNYVMSNPLIFVDPTGKGAEYTDEVAKAMAERGSKNGYTTSVVANPEKKGDFGVVFQKRTGDRLYRGVQFEGKFTGIGKAGLEKQPNTEKSKSLLDKPNAAKNNVEMAFPMYSGKQGAFSLEVNAEILLQDANSNTTLVVNRRGDELGMKYSNGLFEVSADETGAYQVDVLLWNNMSIGINREGKIGFTANSSNGYVNSSTTIYFDKKTASDNLNRFVSDVGKSFVKNLDSYSITPAPGFAPIFIIP